MHHDDENNGNSLQRFAECAAEEVGISCISGVGTHTLVFVWSDNGGGKLGLCRIAG